MVLMLLFELQPPALITHARCRARNSQLNAERKNRHLLALRTALKLMAPDASRAPQKAVGTIHCATKSIDDDPPLWADDTLLADEAPEVRVCKGKRYCDAVQQINFKKCF